MANKTKDAENDRLCEERINLLSELGFKESKTKLDLWVLKVKSGDPIFYDCRKSKSVLSGDLYTYNKSSAIKKLKKELEIKLQVKVRLSQKWKKKPCEEKHYPEKYKDEGWKIIHDGRLLSEVELWGIKQYKGLGHFLYPAFTRGVVLKLVPFLHDKVTRADIRGFEHFFLVWNPGWYKSSIAFSFFGSNGIINSSWRMSDPDSISPERFRGDFKRRKGELQIALPYPTIDDFICVDELISFIGTGQDRAKTVSLINSIIEKQRGSNSFIKMAGVTTDMFDKAISRFPKFLQKRFEFDELESSVTWQSKTTLIFSSNLSKAANLKDLYEMGFLSRFTCFTWDANWEDKYELLLSIGKKTKACNKKSLRYAFHILSKTKFKEVNLPPEEYIKRLILEHKLQSAKRIKNENVRGQLVTGRLRGDIIRMLVAHAIIQQWNRQADGERKYEFDSIQYTEADLEYGKRCIQEMVIQSLELYRLVYGSVEIGEKAKSQRDIEQVLLNQFGKERIEVRTYYRQAQLQTGLSERTIRYKLSGFVSSNLVKRIRSKNKRYLQRTDEMDKLFKGSKKVSKKKEIQE